MSTANLFEIEPYEICSIRPPTENGSITFRLARNCYWNKCAFCPVYKTGAKFSKRPISDVLCDITKAKKIYNFINQQIFLNNPFGRDDTGLYNLISLVKNAHYTHGKIQSLHEKANDMEDDPSLDERTRWFLTWFKDKPTIEDSFTHIYSWILSGGRTCFLGDADSLIFSPDYISTVTESIRTNFPTINRITIYGRTKTAAKARSLEDLEKYASSGINRVHFGMESGSDTVLLLVNKGETAEDHMRAAQKIREAGLSCSVYVMPGLGGADLSRRHACDTAEVITDMKPEYVRLRTVEIFPGTPLEKLSMSGEFTEASEEQIVKEIRTIILDTACETEIISDSATNLLNINGRLPRDRKFMLETIDSYLAMSPREKLEFSFRSRLQSFMGQYGGLSADIYESLSSYITNGSLDMGKISDDKLVFLTRMVRGKLMP